MCPKIFKMNFFDQFATKFVFTENHQFENHKDSLDNVLFYVYSMMETYTDAEVVEVTYDNLDH